MSVAVSDPTADLWRSIVFVQINFPSGAAFGGTGVMVGPNDVLTASHALYMPDQGGAASSVIVTPANWGQAPYGQYTSTSFHYYTDFDPGTTHMLMPGGNDGLATLTGSEHDIGLIDLSTPVGNQTGWMQLDPNFTGGNVNVTGFPAAYGWNMVNDNTSASQGSESIINYSGIQLNPGNSGGPVWYQGNDGQGHVAGVVSTPGWGASVKGVYSDLVNWINGNDNLIAGSQGSQGSSGSTTQTPAPAPTQDTSTTPADTSSAQPPATDTSTTTTTTDTSSHTTTDTSASTKTTDTSTSTTTSQPAADPQHTLTADLAQHLLDYNGDGNADILLRNVNSGELQIHNLSGTSVIGTTGTNIGAGQDWSVAGSGDFNGDGRGDILWHNDNGSVAIWTMNGGSALNSGMVSASSTSQHIAGVGDFNGDHLDDVLWRGDDGTVSTWQMNDHSIVGGGTVGQMSSDWNVAGVGDFNGDSKADVLWRNNNGTVAMWLMDGTSHSGGAAMANAPQDWHVTGIGDFNGDQHSDIVWQQDSGAVSIWLMDGEHAIGGWGSISGTQPGWKLAGVGDFNNDHRSDLLWQDATGNQKVELMDQLHTIAAGNLGSIGTDWVVS